MQIDSYSLTRTSALFLTAGSTVPPRFAELNPKPVRRNAYYDDPAMIADIEKQGWHVRAIELTLTIEMVGSPQ